MAEPNDPFSDEIPEKLTADLSRAFNRRVEIPSDIDQAILAMGRQHAATRRRFRYWRSSIAASAAAAVLFAWLLWPHAPSQRREIAMDLDHSGRVDILDAYLLARQLSAAKPELDVNHDGRVDQLADRLCV